MKTQTSNTAVAVRDHTSPGSHKGRQYRTAFARAVLLFAVMFSLSSCDVYPGGLGYGGGYGRNYSSGIARYANAYTSMYRSTGYGYRSYPRSSGYSSYPRSYGYSGFSTPRNFGGGSSRHSSSYGVQHSYGRSFARPGYGGGFGGSRSSHGGSSHGSRGGHGRH